MSALVLAAIALLVSQAPQRAPLDVVLMVDVSHSMTYGFIKRDRGLVPAAASALADALEPGDVARVGTFGSDITIDPAPLGDPAAIRTAAAALGERIGGPSPLWDALDAAARALAASDGRRAIVVVTDGRTSGNRLGFEDTRAALARAGVPVFVVSLDKSDRALPDPGARLERIAAATGGTCVFVERGALPGAIKRAVGTLRARP
jgi:Mg-chelatase subunit ChlD